MTTTMPAPAKPRYCATAPSAGDPKKSPFLNLLARHQFAPTAGAADDKLDKAIAIVLSAARIAVVCGQEMALDQALAQLDEVRTAGVSLKLSTEELVSIERAECDAEVAREQWELEPTTDSARRAVRATMRAVQSGLKFCRGVRSAHPELVR